MASDINDQVFNEKQFFTDDVVGEDDIEGPFELGVSPFSLQPPLVLPSLSLAGGGAASATESPLEAASALAVAGSSGALSTSVARETGIVARQQQSAAANRSGSPSTSPAVGAREKRRKRAAERATKIVFWLETKYDVLPEVCRSFENWKEAPSATYDFDLLWCDTAIAADRFMKLKLYQKMNHFVGMSSITRKNNLGRNLLRMRKQLPKEYKFFPDTWILPTDLSDFKNQFANSKNKTFIVKPDNGCQGKGIFLVRDVEKVPVDFSTTYVAQRYINKPFLLSGFKFDLRLYVLVVGCDPLRVFIHKRGLVRLASEQYVEPTNKNLQQSMVHLTNYAINKFNPNFEENTNPDDASDGHKRSWEAVQEQLRREGHDVDQLNAEIEDLIVKTLIAVQPSLSHFYHSCQPDDIDNSMCFEILGFDVMLDQKLQPWLLEVNHAPSFATESELDRMVKTQVLTDTFVLLNLTPEVRRQKKRDARDKMELRAMGQAKKQTMEERAALEQHIARERSAWEEAHAGGFKRLYPSEAKEREYMAVYDAAVNIWEMLMGGTSRRTVRLMERTEEEAAKEEPKKGRQARHGDKGEGKSEAASKDSVKRTPEQVREVVDRLVAGCSSRPRNAEGRRRGGPAAEPQRPPVAALASVDDEEASAPAQASTRHARPDVQVGDVIKVQTNLGWEAVTVRAKRANGKVDIQFKDGEYMRSVLPRILKDAAGNAAPGAEVAPEAAASAATSAAAAAAAPAVAGAGAGGPLGGGSPSTPPRARPAPQPEVVRAPVLPPAVEWPADAPLSTRPIARAPEAEPARPRPGRDAPSPVIPPLGVHTGRGALRSAAEAPARAQEVRLRQHLQQLISVRPIATRRAGDGLVGC